MKKNIKILFAVGIGIIALTIIIYSLVSTNNKAKDGQDAQSATFSNNDLGIQFNYPTGPDGYVLGQATSTDVATEPLNTLILFRTEDVLNQPPVGGEGPPVIVIMVFRNSQNQELQTWAASNTRYSNVNLRMGDVLETSLDGQKAIKYRADGLYTSENVVSTYKDKAYILTGQFMTEDADIRRDFEEIIKTVRFIP